MKTLAIILGGVLLMVGLSAVTLAQNVPRGLPFNGTRTFCDDPSKWPGGRAPKVIVSISKDGVATVKTDIYGEGYQDTGTAFGRPYTFSGKLTAKWTVKRSSDTFLVVKSATTVFYAFGQDSFDMKICEAPPKEGSDTPATPPRSPQTYAKITFQEVKDLPGLAKSFPFLKQSIEDVISNNKYSAFQPTKVYVSDLHQNGQARLLFMLLTGMNCGSGGCSFMVYMDQGNGFKDVLDALAAEGAPVYISQDQLSLLTCGRDGRVEWQFKNNSFEPAAGKPLTSQELVPCSRTARQ